MCSVSNPWIFFTITFLVALRTKTNKCEKNESERARKTFCCFNFLYILNLPVNLNFVRARFEFDITSYYMAKNLCSQNLELLIIKFLFFFAYESSVQFEAFCWVSLLLPSSFVIAWAPKVGKTKGNKFPTISVSGLSCISQNRCTYW